VNRLAGVARTFLGLAGLAGALALAACQGENLSGIPAKALKPLPREMVALIESKNMDLGSPILARIFKEESEVEIWKQDRSGRFALLKTYPICRWSGELGPKIKEGDRQAPEGFYTITPAQMNPHSAYHLAVNIGYPNEFDRANGRTGSHLMIHGDCSSRGCYAMTDEQMSEIYALARDSFFAGQRTFQVQAFPFRMTPLNMARHRNNPNMPFWKMLKQGYDHFEVTRLQPKVDVCDRRYVFNAEPAAGTRFNPTGPCPPYTVRSEIAEAVAEKTRRDEQQTVALIRSGVAAAPVKTGRDGGMHRSFYAQLTGQEVRFENGDVRAIPNARAPTSFLSTSFSPPQESTPAAGTPAASTAFANVPMPRPAPRAKVGARLASTGSVETQQESVMQRVGASFSRWIGLANDEEKAAASAAAERAPSPQHATSRSPQAATTASSIAPRPRPHVQPQTQPEATASADAGSQSRALSFGGTTTISGAAPVIRADSFESRWSAAR
jgi:murein L,D-transpeptidase YafK